METWLPIVLQLVSGLIGGNLAGSGLKDKSLGSTGNSIAGALGGLGLGQLLPLLGLGDGGTATDMTSILTSVLGGGGGGAILTAVAGMLFKGKKA
ncbi:MAG: hypothetical protein WDA03_07540 [Trueperaceae bacterium]|jgi:hypothetical protein